MFILQQNKFKIILKVSDLSSMHFKRKSKNSSLFTFIFLLTLHPKPATNKRQTIQSIEHLKKLFILQWLFICIFCTFSPDYHLISFYDMKESFVDMDSGIVSVTII